MKDMKDMEAWKMKSANFSELVGKTIKSVEGGEKGDNEFWVETTDGWVFVLHHEQDCCECVDIEDADWDGELVGGLVINAEEVSGESGYNDEYESYTYTFYKLDTTKGNLWLRWLGTQMATIQNLYTALKNL